MGVTVSPTASATGSCPGGQPYLEVHVTGTVSAERYVCQDEIHDWHDLVDPPYRTRSIPGRDPQDEPNPHEALSIRELATRLAGEIGGFSADSITYVDIPNPRSSWVSRLDTADLGEAGQNGFDRGLKPAVFVDTDGIWYIRPLRPGSQDTNNRDFFNGATAGPLEIYLHTSGTPLHPTIAVAATDAKVGDRSRFTVTFDPPTSEHLDYDWSFGADGSSTAAEPRHRWSTAGTYQVYLEVSRPGQPKFQSNLIEMTIAAKDPDDDHHPGGGGHGGPHNPHDGPVDGDGHQGGAPESSGDPDGTGDDGTGDTSGTTSGTTSDGSSTDQDTPPAEHARTSPEQPPDDGAEPPASDGGTVTGIVLTGADAAVTSREPSPTAPAASTGTRDRPLTLPGWVGLAGVGLLVLALGAVNETGWFQRGRRG